MEGQVILTEKGLKKISNSQSRQDLKTFFPLEKYERINYKLMGNYVYNDKKANPKNLMPGKRLDLINVRF